MRALVFVLAIVASLFGLLYLQSVQQRPAAPVAAESLVITQLVERPAITTEVERTVTVLVTNTTELESRLAGLKTDLAQAGQSLQAEEARSAALDKERVKLQVQLGVVSNHLALVQRQYMHLKATNEATESELSKVQGQRSALELEKASLVRRLNNLDELRTQVRVVKKEVWAQKVAQWKQNDTADAAGGNRGYLKLRGQWTGSPTNQPPQN